MGETTERAGLETQTSKGILDQGFVDSLVCKWSVIDSGKKESKKGTTTWVSKSGPSSIPIRPIRTYNRYIKLLDRQNWIGVKQMAAPPHSKSERFLKKDLLAVLELHPAYSRSSIIS